jgi:sporulation protein YlmC with PRC-barrel domain
MNTILTRDLEKLTQSGLELADPATDLRGRDVFDRDDQAVGTVADVLIDLNQRKARMLEVVSGGGLLGIGKKQFLVPIEAVIGGDPRTVYIDKPKDEILAGPAYQPDQIDEEEDHYAEVYAHYGTPPYWVAEPPPEKVMSPVTPVEGSKTADG